MMEGVQKYGGGGGGGGCGLEDGQWRGAVFHSQHVAAGCVRSITQTQSNSVTPSSPGNRKQINQ